MAQLPVDIIVRLRNAQQATGQLNRLNQAQAGTTRRTQQLSRASQGLAGNLAKTAIAFRAFREAQRAIRIFTQFEKEMTKINTLVGVNRSLITGWTGDIRKLAIETGKSIDELARGMFFVTSAGERSADAIDILRNSAKAAAIGLGDVSAVANAVTSVMQAYGKETVNAAQATEFMVQTVREGKIQSDELASVIGRVLPVAAMLKVNIADLGAAIAIFTRLGVSAAEAVTGVRQALLQLLKTSEGQQRSIRALNGTYEDIRNTIEREGLAQALVKLGNLTKGNTSAYTRLIPRIRALTAIMALSGEQAGKFVTIQERMRHAIEGMTAESARAFAVWSRTTEASFKKARTTIDDLMQAMARDFVPFLRRFLNDLNRTLNTDELQRQFAIFGRELGMMVDQLGSALVAVVQHFEAIRKLMLGMMAMGFIRWAINLGRALKAWTIPLALAAFAIGAVADEWFKMQAAAQSAQGIVEESRSLYQDMAKAVQDSNAALREHNGVLDDIPNKDELRLKKGLFDAFAEVDAEMASTREEFLRVIGIMSDDAANTTLGINMELKMDDQEVMAEFRRQRDAILDDLLMDEGRIARLRGIDLPIRITDSEEQLITAYGTAFRKLTEATGLARQGMEAFGMSWESVREALEKNPQIYEDILRWFEEVNIRGEEFAQKGSFAAARLSDLRNAVKSGGEALEISSRLWEAQEQAVRFNIVAFDRITRTFRIMTQSVKGLDKDLIAIFTAMMQVTAAEDLESFLLRQTKAWHKWRQEMARTEGQLAAMRAASESFLRSGGMDFAGLGEARRQAGLQSALEAAFTQASGGSEVEDIERAFDRVETLKLKIAALNAAVANGSVDYRQAAVESARLQSEYDNMSAKLDFLRQLLPEVTKRIEEMANTEAAGKFAAQLAGAHMSMLDQTDALQAQVNLFKLGSVEAQVQLEISRMRRDAELLGLAATEEQRAVLEEMLGTMDALLRKELERQQKLRKELRILQLTQQAYLNFLENLQRQFGATIKQMLDGELDSFDDFFESVFDMFKQMLADMVAAALAAKIIIPIQIELEQGKGPIQALLAAFPNLGNFSWFGATTGRGFGGGFTGSNASGGAFASGNRAATGINAALASIGAAVIAKNIGGASDTGVMIAGIVGAVASIWLGPILGAVVGGFVGSLFKATKTHGVVEMAEEEGRLATGEARGLFAEQATEVGNVVADTFNELLAGIGGVLVDIASDIEFGVYGTKGKNFKVIVDGVVHKFKKNMEEAIGFAVAELLKSAEISGISDVMQTALQNTDATTLEGLEADIQIAQDLDALIRGVSDVFDSLGVLLEKGRQLGIGQTDLIAATDTFILQFTGVDTAFMDVAAQAEDLRTVIQNMGFDAATTADMLERVAMAERMRNDALEADILERFANLLSQIPGMQAETNKLMAQVNQARFQIEVEMIRMQLEAMNLMTAAFEKMLDAAVAFGKDIKHFTFRVPKTGYAAMLEDRAAERAREAEARRREREQEAEARRREREQRKRDAARRAAERERDRRALQDLLMGFELNDFQNQVRKLQETFNQAAYDARRLGISEERVRVARNKAIKDLIDSVFEPIEQFRRNLLETQPGTAAARFAEAQRTFEDIRRRALAGDVDAIKEFPNAAQKFLDQSGDFFGTSSGAFRAIFNEVLADVDALQAERDKILNELFTEAELAQIAELEKHSSLLDQIREATKLALPALKEISDGINDWGDGGSGGGGSDGGGGDSGGGGNDGGGGGPPGGGGDDGDSPGAPQWQVKGAEAEAFLKEVKVGKVAVANHFTDLWNQGIANDAGLAGSVRGLIKMNDINASIAGGYWPFPTSDPGGGIDPGPIEKAMGGSAFRGESYMVGEQGPELFTPYESGFITPNHRLGMGSDDAALRLALHHEDNERRRKEHAETVATIEGIEQKMDRLVRALEKRI